MLIISADVAVCVGYIRRGDGRRVHHFAEHGHDGRVHCHIGGIVDGCRR